MSASQIRFSAVCFPAPQSKRLSTQPYRLPGSETETLGPLASHLRRGEMKRDAFHLILLPSAYRPASHLESSFGKTRAKHLGDTQRCLARR